LSSVFFPRKINNKINVLFDNFFLPWVLPVDVQSVEFVLPEELDGFIDELVHSEDVAGQLFEGGGSEGPSSDRQQDLNQAVEYVVSRVVGNVIV
jgi:hypothetical protein